MRHFKTGFLFLPYFAVAMIALNGFAASDCSLITHNPFFNKEKEVQIQPKEIVQIDDEVFPFEFQGVLLKSGKQLFRIQNKDSNEGLWLSLGDKMDGMEILDFYKSTFSLSVVYNAKNQMLPLKERSKNARRLASRSKTPNPQQFENRIPIRSQDRDRKTPPRVTPPKIPNRLPPAPKRFVKPQKA